MITVVIVTVAVSPVFQARLACGVPWRRRRNRLGFGQSCRQRYGDEGREESTAHQQRCANATVQETLNNSANSRRFRQKGHAEPDETVAVQ